MGRYQKRRTALKAFTPLLIVPVAIAVENIARVIGVEISSDRSYEVSIGLFGLVRGVANWIKHRRRGNNG